MNQLTFKQYQVFQNKGLKVKVTEIDNLFYGYVCPVISIGIDWVTCDVDNDGGTESFAFNQIEISNDEVKYDEY